MPGRADRVLHSPSLLLVVVALAAALGAVLYRAVSPVMTLDEVAVSVNAKRANGSPWDFGGGRPDVAVVVEARDGSILARCPQMRDSLEARCRPGVRVEPRHSPVLVKAVDGDTSADDAIGELVVSLPDDGSVEVSGTGGITGVQLVLTGHSSAWARLRPGIIAIGIGGAAVVLLWLLVLGRWVRADPTRSRFVALLAGTLVAAGAVLVLGEVVRAGADALAGSLATGSAVASGLATGGLALVAADARHRERLSTVGALIVFAALAVILAPVAVLATVMLGALCVLYAIGAAFTAV